VFNVDPYLPRLSLLYMSHPPMHIDQPRRESHDKRSSRPCTDATDWRRRCPVPLGLEGYQAGAGGEAWPAPAATRSDSEDCGPTSAELFQYCGEKPFADEYAPFDGSAAAVKKMSRDGQGGPGAELVTLCSEILSELV